MQKNTIEGDYPNKGDDKMKSKIFTILEILAASLSWGWALFTTFSGLRFGILREETGSLLAPGIAHGLPDAVGEALGRIFGWM
jgi:membrane protease YdiL (CAAX protease family)